MERDGELGPEDEITLCLPFNVCDEEEAIRTLARIARKRQKLRQQQPPQQSSVASDSKTPAPSAASAKPAPAPAPSSTAASSSSLGPLSLSDRLNQYKARREQAKQTCFFAPSQEVETDLSAHFRCFVGAEPLSAVWRLNEYEQPTSASGEVLSLEKYVARCAEQALCAVPGSTAPLATAPAAASAAATTTTSSSGRKPNPYALNNLGMCALMGFGCARDMPRVASVRTQRSTCAWSGHCRLTPNLLFLVVASSNRRRQFGGCQ
jgi:hypothetical protein